MKTTKNYRLKIVVFVFLGILANIISAQDSVDVTFFYKPPGSNPANVYLPGEFNGWNIYADPMTFDSDAGVWHVTKRLRVGGPNPLPDPGKSVPGAYQYKFNLNGSTWIVDPLNPRNNMRDNNNSYLFIKSPTIHYLLPNSLTGLVETRYPQISAYIFPATISGVDTASLRITIDNIVYENIGSAYDPETNYFTFTPPEPVSNGSHKLKLYVESTTASVSEDSTTFIVQTGFIQFLTQKNERFLRSEINITGTTDEADLEVTLLRIGVDSVQTISDSTGKFSVAISLNEGENKFQAFTTDNNDNEYQSDILIIDRFIDHSPKPIINLSADQSTVFFVGTANDPDQDQVTYQWRSDDDINPEPLNITSQEPSFSIPIPVTPGEYYFDLSVTDPDMNAGYSRNYFTVNLNGTVRVADINTNPAWVQDAVVYEIYVPSFTSQGTIAAAQERLAEIKNIGANVVWFMPIYENGEWINELNAGYNITDFYKVHPQLGTLNDLQNFLDAAHEMGIRVILDATPNHASAKHPFVKDIELYRDYSNYRPIFEKDILGDDRDLGQTKKLIDGYTHYVYYSNWSLANIDYTSIEARDYMIDMYKYWVLDVGMDGYRMDVYWGPNNRYGKNVWWRPFRNEIKRVKPDILLLGETDGTGTGSENNYADGGGGMDAAYDWSLYGEIKSTVNGSSINNLDDKVRNYSPNLAYNYYTGPNAHYFRFIENHDETRFASLYPLAKAKAAASLLLTVPGIPMIYAGQEVGETSRRGPIDWTRQGAEEMLAHYTKLGQIRTLYPAIRTDLIRRISSGSSGLYSFVRPYMDENAIVILSFSPSTLTAHLSISQTDLLLTDSLEYGKNYYMNDVYNDTVYTVTRTSMLNFQAVVDPYGAAIFVLSDSAFDDINSISDNPVSNPPIEFELHQNFPNPFNPETQISFSLPEKSHVQLLVYDLLGREVSRLMDTERPAGNYSVTWQGQNQDGMKVGSGIYFYRLVARDGNSNLFSQTRKMIILK